MALQLLLRAGKKKAVGAITSVPIAKNLTKRRADFEDIVKIVDKHKSPTSKKIKYDAAKKISKIHDKYDAIKASGKK